MISLFITLLLPFMLSAADKQNGPYPTFGIDITYTRSENFQTIQNVFERHHGHKLTIYELEIILFGPGKHLITSLWDTLQKPRLAICWDGHKNLK